MFRAQCALSRSQLTPFALARHDTRGRSFEQLLGTSSSLQLVDSITSQPGRCSEAPEDTDGQQVGVAVTDVEETLRLDAQAEALEEVGQAGARHQARTIVVSIDVDGETAAVGRRVTDPTVHLPSKQTRLAKELEPRADGGHPNSCSSQPLSLERDLGDEIECERRQIDRNRQRWDGQILDRHARDDVDRAQIDERSLDREMSRQSIANEDLATGIGAVKGGLDLTDRDLKRLARHILIGASVGTANIKAFLRSSIDSQGEDQQDESGDSCPHEFLQVVHFFGTLRSYDTSRNRLERAHTLSPHSPEVHPTVMRQAPLRRPMPRLGREPGSTTHSSGDCTMTSRQSWMMPWPLAGRRTVAAASSLLVALSASASFAASDETLPRAAEILDRHVEATGGRDAHLRIQSRKMTGHLEVDMAGHQLAARVERQAEAPSNAYLLVEGPQVVQLRASNSDDAWEWRPRHSHDPSTASMSERLEGDERARAIEGARFHDAVDWRQLIKDAKTTGITEIAGRPAYEVQVTTQSGDAQRRFYDVENGRQVKTVRSMTSPSLGDLEMEVFLEDYRELDGIWLPTRVREVLHSARYGDGSQIWTYSKIEHNVEIPPQLFELPSELREQ